MSARTPYSVWAASRHLNNHVRPLLRAQAAADVATYAERLASLADAARDERQHAASATLRLSALRAEADVLVRLFDRLGISGEDTIDILREARTLAVAVHRVLADEPRIATALATELSAQGESDLASVFSRLANAASERNIAALSERIVVTV